MTSAGIAKTAIAFSIGVALALGGVGLYTHLAPHAQEAVQTTVTTPEVPDSVDRLPDDDAVPAPPPKLEAPKQAEAPNPPAHAAAKPHVEPAHTPVRRAVVPTPHKVSRRPEPKHLLLVQNKLPIGSQPSQANPYATADEPTGRPSPQPQASHELKPSPQLQPSPGPEVQSQPQLQPPPPPTVTEPQPAPQPRQPRTVTIPVGTRLNIRTNQTLSSDHNFAGDTFQGTLESPIIFENALIAERGSKVTGKVVNVQRGRADAGSDLSITLTQINTTDGQRVPVQTSTYDQQTTRNTGQDAAKVGGGAALGAIIGAVAGGGKGAAIGAGVGGAAGGGDVLLSHGRPAVVQSETQIGFRLTAPITITEHFNN